MASISVVCKEELIVDGDNGNYHRVKKMLLEKGYSNAAENVRSVRVLVRSLQITFSVDFPLGWEVRRALSQEFGVGETTEAPNGTSKYLHRQGGRKYKFPIRRDMRRQ